MKTHRIGGRFSILLSVAVTVAAAMAAPASADDRDLLYTQQAAPPNVMVIVSNTTTMANLPGSTTLGPIGGVDGPVSKMGIAKSALNNIIKSNPGVRWGISSFSYDRADLTGGTKHFIFQPADDDFEVSGNLASYGRAAGTKINFGLGMKVGNGSGTLATCNGSPPATTPCQVKYNSVSYAVVTSQGTSTSTLPSGSTVTYNVSSSPTSASDTTHLPWCGTDGSIPMLIIGVGGLSEYEEVFQITTSNPYGITSGNHFTVSETIYHCKNAQGNGSSAPCDFSNTSNIFTNDTKTNDSVEYVIPPEYCREDNASCDFPQLFGYGADVNKEIGWASIPTADSSWLDWIGNNSSGNASGWLNHSNVNPQPIVMIPRDWTNWTPYCTPGGQCQIKGANPEAYTQNTTSVPCIVRTLRPDASVVHISSTSVYSAADNFPTWNAATQVSTPSGYDQNGACDTNLDGYFQRGNYLGSGSNNSLIAPIFPTKNGNVAPLQGLLTDVFGYFNGGNTPGRCNALVDTFCGGQRPDDPQKTCRHDYVILVTDSFAAQSAITLADVLPFTQVNNPGGGTTGGIKIYVIGFGVAAGDAGQTNVCTLPDGTAGNNGACIAWWSNAQTYSGTTLAKQGYYTADNYTKLQQALQSIVSGLDETNRDFATATIPSVSSVSEGVAYLSEFNPQNERSIWSGHLRAFVLNPITGLIQTDSQTGFPLATPFVFGSGTTAPAGSLLWESGTSTGVGSASAILGNLDSSSSNNPSGIDPTALLDNATPSDHRWSDSNHDQALGSGIRVGRNVFFGIKPGDSGCTSTSYECIAQVPVGNTGSTPPAKPSSLPTWWNNVRDNCLYARIPPASIGTCTTLGPGSVPESGTDRDQALQNSFSFIRGNRDPVVESLKLSTVFDATHTSCALIKSDPITAVKSPCYDGDVLGDIFHSNPVVVSFPQNVRYYFAQDPSAVDIGTYADRDGTDQLGTACTKPCKSYQTFFTSYAHRRKVLFSGADDGLMHAFDIGVYNGDLTSYTVNGSAFQPYLNHYDLGSGREIFGYAPRAALNKFYQLAHTIQHDWTVDGPPVTDDVYIDVANVGGTPRGIAASGAGADLSGTNPQWRTVLIGIEREGGTPSQVGRGSVAGGGISAGTSGNGGSVFALDVTDPDQAAHMTQSDSGGHTGVPECLVGNFDPANGSTSPPTNCAAPYPRILWELRDDQSVSGTTPYPQEKSGVNEKTTQDLGFTWSRPVVGRIKVHDTVANAHRDYFVAIFGGGFDHSGSAISNTNTAGNTGNFLYMVDIETGKIIYKRNLGICDNAVDSGCASGTNTTGNLAAALPGEPAIIDLNNDGYLDRIYVGDTQGRIWKVDLTTEPDFTSSTIVTTFWRPTLFFDEYSTASPGGGNIRQPIFNRPAAFLLGTTSSGVPRVGIAVGTGDRDNMPALQNENHPNLFLALVDDPTFSYPVFLSNMTAASLTSNACSAANTCLSGTGRGYYISLPTTGTAAEIVNTDALVFNNTIFFNTFLLAPPGVDPNTGQAVCNQKGDAFFYKLNYLTGVSLYLDANGNPTNHQDAGAEVASAPILYQDQKIWVVSATDNTKVPTVGGGNPPAAIIKTWKEE